MAEWLVEHGIGETRRVLIDRGAILEAIIEPDDAGPQAGEVHEARLTCMLVTGRSGLARLADGTEVLIEPLDPKVTEGAALTVEILREAIPEPGNKKRAKARLFRAQPAIRRTADREDRGDAPGDWLHGDALEDAGWSELLEQAATGAVPFPGGALRISLTPAMTLIDVDGTLPRDELAVAGAAESARAIRRLGIGGSIGIDLPTIAGKAGRSAAALAFDAALPQPFERTAVNGFGFLQIVRPRPRASLPERFHYAAAASHARALLRRVGRSGLIGSLEITAAPTVATVLESRPEWLATLSAAMGGAIALRSDATLAISGGHVRKI